MEKDYDHLHLSFKRPEEVGKRQLAVKLPSMIFRNIAGLFHVLLDAIDADEHVSTDAKRDQAMKVMLFANLMINQDATSRRTVLQSLAASKIWAND